MRKPTDTLTLARKLPLFDSFLATLRTDKTRESYGYALGHWAKFLSEKSEPAHSRGDYWRSPFCEWLDKNGFSKASTPYHLSAVTKYLKYTKEQSE